CADMGSQAADRYIFRNNRISLCEAGLIFCRIGRPHEGLSALPAHRPPTMSSQFFKVPTSSFSKRIHRDDSTNGVSTADSDKTGEGSVRNARGDKFYRCHAHSSQDWPRL